MKKTDLTNLEGDEFEEALTGFDGFCDIKDNPEEVLEQVSLLLRRHGLEVEIAYTGDCDTMFRIIKRKGGKSK